MVQLTEIFALTTADADGCRIWTGRSDRYGYPRIWVDGRHRGLHRIVYELHAGPIPAELTVDHLCWKPMCVNPDHLRLLSRSENSRRQRSALATHCARGHEFTPENTYIRPSVFRCGVRQCRACNLEAVRAYVARKRAARMQAKAGAA